MIDRLLNVFAPHRCCSCGEKGAILCERCKNDMLEEPFCGCVVCLRPCGAKGVCEACSRTLACDQAWCVGERDGPLKDLLDRYKFSSSRAAADVLGSLLDERLPLLPPETCVVGVPTSASTRRVRGFDHMGMIAEIFAQKRGLVVSHPLERATNVTLHFLSKRERVRLGPSLFRLSSGLVPETVLLLDDIVTTGTTLKAAAKLLRKAGVKQIYLAAIARQPDKKITRPQDSEMER